MIASAGTEALIALEDRAPDLLFEQFPGTKTAAWPLARWPVARSMAEIELKSTVVTARSLPGQTLMRRARAALPNPHTTASISGTREIVFMVSGTTFGQRPDGRYNWLVDDHAAALGPRAAVLQEAAFDVLTPRAHRPALRETYTLQDLSLAGRVEASSTPLPLEIVNFIDSFVDRVYAHLEFDVDPVRVENTKKLLGVRYSRSRHVDRRVLGLLDRIGARMVFIQGAAYGNRAPLIAQLKDRGVTVIEHQHGWIGPTHLAYNFGAAMSSPLLLATLPDVLLTFGDFWSESIRFPGETVSIGKPHIENMAALAHTKPDRSVLVISGMYEREEMTRFVRELRDGLPADWQVLLRPHPAERSTVAELYPGLVGEKRVHFDLEPDVYVSLAATSGVFGLASTVLYEAIAFDRPVFVIDSPLADLTTDESVFGERISDAESRTRAIGIILNRYTGRVKDAASSRLVERLWKKDGVAAFTSFVDSRL